MKPFVYFDDVDVGYCHDDDVVRYNRWAIARVVNWEQERNTILQIYDNKYIVEFRSLVIDNVKTYDEITHNQFIRRIIYTSEFNDGEGGDPPFNPSGQKSYRQFRYFQCELIMKMFDLKIRSGWTNQMCEYPCKWSSNGIIFANLTTQVNSRDEPTRYW